MTANPVPRLPAWLGYAGLIPFVFFASMLWMAPPQWHDLLVSGLTGYAAVILSFMGAVHWGLGMSNPGKAGAWQLGLSVIPPLLAWLALALPLQWALPTLIVGFGAICIADAVATQRKLAPAWYPELRTPLTVGVMLSLISATLVSA
jgi:hypothetical protein